MAPGWENGKMEDFEMHPALPKLVDWPGSSESISVTWAPCLARYQAQDEPTMPEPITMQLFISTEPVYVGYQPFQHNDSSV
jgi:hypothetical protein